MGSGIKLHVWGQFACFTRPEMKGERVSYDVMTPSAARGIIEAVYWKPEIRWCIDRIHVMKPIRFTNIRRNELGSVLQESRVKTAMKDGCSPVEVFIEDEGQRQQRASMILRDVEYYIHAHFELMDPADHNHGKHTEMIRRRAAKGQCFQQPYFGTREFPANFELFEDAVPPSCLIGEQDLGWMLHDIDFQHDNEPRFFRAKMRDGVIEVPPFHSDEVKS